MKIIVLLSTYNGEKYLREQLDSLLSQTVVPDIIYVRDDGSSDRTVDILKEYSESYGNIKYYQGNNLRPAKSFWELIVTADNADYYFLCDQDDVWMNDKIERAVSVLEKEDNSKPLLYCGKYTLTDEKLVPLNAEVSKLYNYTDFAHSLIYHTAPGCTMAFNNATREYLFKYDVNKNYVVIHDAIIHKVAALFGKVILDNESHIYYRQHSNNEIGMSSGVIGILKTRINNYTSGKLKNYRMKSAEALLNVYGDECSEDKKELLKKVAFYKNNLKYKWFLMTADCFKSHSINDLFFAMLVLLNYV